METAKSIQDRVEQRFNVSISLSSGDHTEMPKNYRMKANPHSALLECTYLILCVR